MNQPELRDIHLPDTSLWWPPAPGWWLLLITLLLLAAAGPWLLKRLRQKPLRRLSLLELARIRREYERQRSRQTALREVAALLRRILIAYRGRAAVAASTGDAWLQQLQQLSPRPAFSPEQLALFGHDRYRPAVDCDIDSLFAACERWIESLPRRFADDPA